VCLRCVCAGAARHARPTAVSDGFTGSLLCIARSHRPWTELTVTRCLRSTLLRMPMSTYPRHMHTTTHEYGTVGTPHATTRVQAAAAALRASRPRLFPVQVSSTSCGLRVWTSGMWQAGLVVARAEGRAAARAGGLARAPAEVCSRGHRAAAPRRAHRLWSAGQRHFFGPKSKLKSLIPESTFF
jgi:hypothetical protein